MERGFLRLFFCVSSFYLFMGRTLIEYFLYAGIDGLINTTVIFFGFGFLNRNFLFWIYFCWKGEEMVEMVKEMDRFFAVI